MTQGGRRDGSGRPEGLKNRRTVELEAKQREAAATLAAVLPDAFDGDAHALLMLVSKDRRQPIDLRLEAAGKAIRYEKPALATIDMSTTGSVRHVILDRPMTTEQWEAQFCDDVTEH